VINTLAAAPGEMPSRLPESPWHNPILPGDVDDDGDVDKDDATKLLGFLDTFGSQAVPGMSADGTTLQPDGFFDVDGDHAVEPRDLLRLLNSGELPEELFSRGSHDTPESAVFPSD